MPVARSALALLILVGYGSIALATATASAADEQASSAPAQALEEAPLILNEQRISSAGIAGGDFFGWSIAVSGDTALVGAWLDDDRGRDAGAAHVFVRQGQTWLPQAKLTAADARAGNYFGAAVALDGDRALIGAPLGGDDAYFAGDAGSAYLFERRGTRWEQIAKLTVAKPASGDLFGRALALAGDTALIGAYGDRDNGVNSGAAYLFEATDAGWVERAKLKADDGGSDDRFGSAVALDGGTALIGAYRDDDRGVDAGSVYVFTASEAGWKQQAKLSAADGSDLGFFGFSVAIQGDTALIGAWRDDRAGSDAGAAYLFQRKKGVWRQQQKLSGQVEQGRFGYAVALLADQALIGAYLDDSNEQGAGRAYLFSREGRGWRQRGVLQGDPEDAGFGIAVALDEQTALVGAVMEEVGVSPGVVQAYAISGQGARPQGRLSTPQAAIGDRFGAAVALSASYALIGAPKARSERAELAGAAYVFEREALDLGRHRTLSADDGAIGDRFGRALAISGEQLLIGAPAAKAEGDQAGAAYIFQHGDKGWREAARLTAGGGGVRAAFGRAVALAGDTALVGAPGDTEGASGAGAAYAFRRTARGWQREAKLIAADPTVDAQFGSALALSDDLALIGAYRDNERGRLSGAVYVFARGPEGWQQVQKLRARDARARQYFGYSVALDAETALIGAWGDDDQGPNAGAVYVFRRADEGWLQQQKLVPESMGARLGIAVALAGQRALAGGYLEDEQRGRIGVGHLFDATEQGWRLQARLRAGPTTPNDGMAVALTADAALLGTNQADASGRVSFFRFGLAADDEPLADADPD